MSVVKRNCPGFAIFEQGFCRSVKNHTLCLGKDKEDRELIYFLYILQLPYLTLFSVIKQSRGPDVF